jgi:hypothetical protein
METILKDYPISIKGHIYDVENGIKLAKTLYGNDYDKLPEGLKHEHIKNKWDEYEGIEQNLYLMSLSVDQETIDLTVEILKSKNIPFRYYEKHVNATGKYKLVPYKIFIFPDSKNLHYSKSSEFLWNKLD